jgi:hypothetical protein
MADFKQRHQGESIAFTERRTKGRVVAFRPDIVAGPRPSPARILQESLARQGRNDFYASDRERRAALVRFLGTAALLWAAMGGILTILMIAAS